VTKRPDRVPEPIDRLCKMLGLAKRAGKLQCGTDLCCDAVRHKKAKMVLLCENAAENTKKRVRNCCTYYHTDCHTVKLDVDTLSHAVGAAMSLATVAVTDDGFARAIAAMLGDSRSTDIPTKPQEVQG